MRIDHRNWTGLWVPQAPRLRPGRFAAQGSVPLAACLPRTQASAAIVTKQGSLAFSVPKPYSTQAAIDGLGEVEMPAARLGGRSGQCDKRHKRVGIAKFRHNLLQGSLVCCIQPFAEHPAPAIVDEVNPLTPHDAGS